MAKSGLATTFTYIFIQGCWLHFTGTMISGLLNSFRMGADFGCWLSFHSGFSFGAAWMLWSVLSLLRNSTVCPIIAPTTCGSYRQPTWSTTTWSLGVAQSARNGAAFTYTKTFASLLSFAAIGETRFSPRGLIAQAGSKLISIFTGAGAVPEK